jgi:4-carboxymuconolactone decarboxylase
VTQGNDDRLARAMQTRRAVVGDEYVDRALGTRDEATMVFQEFITEFAWSTWNDPSLTDREHSILVLGMVAALGRMEELAVHMRAAQGRGVDDAAILAILRKIAAYCGVPAGVGAWRTFNAVQADR